MKAASQGRVCAAACVVLVIVTVGALSPLLRAGFVNYDDDEYIRQNIHVARGLSTESLLWALTSTKAANWHPLTWISHMADCSIFGVNPRLHHLTNLLLHAANSVLLLLLMSRMTGGIWRPAFVAALFALHPLHVESVGWLSERKDVLSTLFWMLAMLAYVRYSQEQSAKRYLVVVGLFALGLAAKPMLVTLPLTLLLLDYWPLARLQQAPRSVVKEKIPLLLMSLASSAVTLYAQTKAGAAPSLGSFTLGQRIANALVSYVAYIVKMIWPSRLSIVYPHPKSTLPEWQVIGSALVLAAATWGAIRWRHKYPHVLFGWLWYLVTLIPVIGLVQVGPQAMADRYSYVPLIGVFVIIAWTAPALKLPRRALAAAAVAWLPVLAVRSNVQAGYWRDSIALFGHAIRVTSRNAIAHMHVGVALAEKGRIDEAIEHYLEALEIVPNYDWAHQALGCALLQRREWEGGIHHLREAVRLNPKSAVALSNLGGALAAKGDFAEAEGYLRRAVEADPGDVQARYNLGHFLFQSGRFDEAAVHLRRAVYLAPRFGRAHCELGLSLVQLGRLDEAFGHLRAAVRLDPKNPAARYAVANLLLDRGETSRAASEYRRVLNAVPNHLGALNNLAWIRATDRDPELRNPREAVDLAERLCARTGWRVPQYLDTLAAAYAASGAYERGAATARKASSTARAAGRTDLADRYAQRAARYAARRPPWEND